MSKKRLVDIAVVVAITVAVAIAIADVIVVGLAVHLEAKSVVVCRTPLPMICGRIL